MRNRKKKTNQPGEPVKTWPLNEWIDVKTDPPPFYRVVRLKLKSGITHDDCARIPDLHDKDFYVRDLGTVVEAPTQWMLLPTPVMEPYKSEAEAPTEKKKRKKK